jgi:hypothetical protein
MGTMIYATNMIPKKLPASATTEQIQEAVDAYEEDRKKLAEKDGEFLEPQDQPTKPGIYLCSAFGNPAKVTKLVVVGKSEQGFLYTIDPEHADKSMGPLKFDGCQTPQHPDYEHFKWVGPLDPTHVNPFG